jgi:cytochrome c553
MQTSSTMILAALSVVSLQIGCRTRPPRSDDAHEPPAAITSGRPAELAARMREHDTRAAALRDAVVRGDLTSVRREAKVLAALRTEGVIEAPWRKQLAAMNAAAARVADAGDLADASRDLAGLAKTCGDCHATLGGPQTVVGEVPERVPGDVPRMRRHQWAAERLWDGLVGPSARAWRTGARVLLEAPLEPEVMIPNKSPGPAIGPLASSVHELGRKARVVEAAGDRVAIYGELLVTCSACHQRLGGGPAERHEGSGR